MKGDFTRDTFDARRQFTRVLMQQGRVQLDADWNEQTSILLHYLRTLAADLIGPHGGPTDNLGFGISVPTGTTVGDFVIGAGVYYVDGIRCESAAQSTFNNQADYPITESDKLEQALSPYLVFLDVWERHVTYNEDDSIREVALGGPDTATRAQLVAQVRAIPSDQDLFAMDLNSISSHSVPERRVLLSIILPALIENFTRATGAAKNSLGTKINNFRAALAALSSGRIRARANVPTPSTDPCTISPDARYRGAENQLYRVEIHRSGGTWDGATATAPNAATFKWSRENGSVVFPIRRLEGKVATLVHLGRDDRFGLREGDCVEVIDNDYVLRNRAEQLLFVTAIDRDSLQVTFDRAPGSRVGQDAGKNPLLRRWDHNGRVLKLDAGAALILEGQGDEENWLTLEDGVQIQFQEPAAGSDPNQYRTGDYWLIPARTAMGDVEWPGPRDNPEALPPRGISHHYAPLHRITVDAGGAVTALSGDNLRRHFDAQATT